MESVTLTPADREKLCAHVAEKDGWPAGFGHFGTRIATEAPEENRKTDLTLTAEEMGDLWPKLLALRTDAGIVDEPKPIETLPAAEGATEPAAGG